MGHDSHVMPAMLLFSIPNAVDALWVQAVPSASPYHSAIKSSIKHISTNLVASLCDICNIINMTKVLPLVLLRGSTQSTI